MRAVNTLDAHALLGLAPGAELREIKRAFRRLAMRWHPDRNPDPSASEHFRRLRAAHDALLAGDGDRPADCDGDECAEAAAAYEHDGAHARASRGADRRQELTLTLDEAFTGCERTIALGHEDACEVCDGRGETALAHSRLCAACHGSGRVRDGGRLVGCRDCGGQGYRRTQSCPACAGGGRVWRGRSVSVRVPPGLVTGDVLRLAGEGEPAATPDGRPGDLHLTIVLAPHALFTLDGRDLVVERPVSALRLLIGGPLRIPLPGGAVRTVELSAGTATARRLELPGAGWPGRGNQPDGTLIVKLKPVLPDAADADLHALLAALEAAVAADLARHLPEVAQWEAQWLAAAPGELD
jgi:molecular chaperone DnaJ